jgi:beta-galactosidase
MELIRTNASLKYEGAFQIGLTWLGGSFFLREHPLFKDLPVNQAMNWPYQAVVRDGRNRVALEVEGEELVVGAWHSYPMRLGTAVGVVPLGKGRIVFSTLDICDSIAARGTEREVARKLLCNFIEYAARNP